MLGFSAPEAIWWKVWARSPSHTISLLVPPAGMSGPRISSGTLEEGSCGRYFPAGIRCSPRKNPLSEVKTM